MAALKESRIVTVTGAGGVGKTRLALHVGTAMANDCPDGVWLIDLSPLADPSLVPVAVADVFRLADRHGRPVIDTVCEHLRQKRALLVLTTVSI